MASIHRSWSTPANQAQHAKQHAAGDTRSRPVMDMRFYVQKKQKGRAPCSCFFVRQRATALFVDVLGIGAPNFVARFRAPSQNLSPE